MTEKPPYLAQLGDAQAAVVRALFGALPLDGWTRCAVEYRQTGRIAESKVELTGTDDKTAVVKSPLSMVNALKRLRELMAAQGRGAWLSATITATPGGKCSFDYNYDARPNWTVQPSDETYVADLEQHPRSAVFVPSWYPRGS